MKPNRNKIEGALAEVKSSRSNVRHLISEAFAGEIETIKNDVLAELTELYDGIENFIRYLMNTDLAQEWHREDA
ncbi:MAG: hypothetical protein J6T12_02495 [Salinivirgaceae bacterium]|nr:hypothetical protein [Salinivirgaceae bacterium]